MFTYSRNGIIQRYDQWTAALTHTTRIHFESSQHIQYTEFQISYYPIDARFKLSTEQSPKSEDEVSDEENFILECD